MKKLLSFLLLLFSVFTLFAQNQKDTTSANWRPKVGLVLAGGGARGSAHIGVLKYIQELGIPIDYVTGTSMGSIIGGLTALGYTADEMAEIIRSMDWSMYMSNSTEYHRLGYDEKMNKNKYLLRMSVGDGSLNEMSQVDSIYQESSIRDRVSIMNSLPAAFINGASLLNLFNNLSVGYQDSLDFWDLPVPFACVTLDLSSGKPNIISSGNVGEAIRASMAIPGVFAPVHTKDNKVLIDGGLVNNFPVDVCREMGADIVIGSEVNYGMKDDPSALKSLPGVLNQLLAYETRYGLEENRRKCDVYLHPVTIGFGTMSFDAKSVDTLIARGYAEAERNHNALAAIKNIIDSFPDYKEAERKKTARYIKNDSIEIGSVQVLGLDDYESRKISKRLTSLIGQKVVIEDIESAMQRFYGLKCFSSITYNLLGKEEPYELVVKFNKAAPHHIGVGVRYDTDAAAALLFSAGYNTNKIRGFSAELTARLSYSPYIKTALAFNGGVYTKGHLDYTFSVPRFPWTYFDKSSCRLTLMTHKVELYLSDAHYKKQHFQLGVKYEKFSEIENLSLEGLFDKTYYFRGDFLSAFAKYNVNNTDDNFFPTKGVLLGINAQYTPWVFKNEFFSGNPIFAIHGNLNVNIPISKRVVFEPSIHFRVADNALLIGPMESYVGGEQAGRYFEQQLPFVGINRLSYVSSNVAILRSDLRVKLSSSIYLSGIFNYMRYSLESELSSIIKQDVSYSNFGAGIKCAVNTLVGPVSLTINWSDYHDDKSKFGAYFSVGHYF